VNAGKEVHGKITLNELFLKLCYSRIFLGLVTHTTKADVFFAAVHQPPKGVGKLLFGNG
jgi:hypothetical protein